MTAALTPELALAYLHQLSADIRAAIVLDADGNALAGPPALALPARELLAAAGAPSGSVSGAAATGAPSGSVSGAAATGAPSGSVSGAAAARVPSGSVPRNGGPVLVRARGGRGFAFGARDERHAIVVAAGPLALGGLVLHDLRGVLAALGGGMSEAPVSEAPAAAADAVLGVC